jgi:hypothetical protein
LAEGHERAPAPAPAVAAPTKEHSGGAAGGGSSALAGELLELQQTIGNQATMGLVQAKLVVGAADDPAEREADAIAARVLGGSGGGEPPPRGANDPLGGLEVGPDVSRDIERARGGGSPLPGSLRRELEPGFGTDFSNVRVHTDHRADALNRSLQARAFTTGTDLFFRSGEYAPGSQGGKEIIAHELAHVVQQSGDTAQREVRRLTSAKDFKTSTDEGFFTKRGQAVKAIDEWLKEWEILSKEKGSSAKAKKQEQLLLQMKFATESWIADHTTKETGEEDPGRKKRMIGMKAFLGSVTTELVGVRNVLKGSYSQGPTDDVDVSSASSNFKKLKSKYEGNASSTLNKLAWMIDAAVPNKGDVSELEIEFRWPVDPSGIAFVGGRIKANAQRDSTVGAAAGEQSGVTVRCELVITFGGQWLDVAEAKGELGGYFEASAKNSQDATTLISYAMYRRWRESYVLPDGAANYIWGGRGGSYGKAKAEEWSNNVEAKVFGGAGNEEAYVESGLLAAVGGKVGVKKGNLGGAELEGKLTYTNGTRYDKESIIDAKNQLGAKNTKSKNAKFSDAQTKLGRTVQTLNFTFAATGGPITGELTALAKWIDDKSRDKDDAKAELDSVELEFSGKAVVPTAGHGDLVSKVIRYLGPGLMSLVKVIRRGVEANKQKAKSEGQKAKNFGAVFGSMEDGVPAISQLLKLGEEDGVDFSETKDAYSELQKEGASDKLKDAAKIDNAKENMGVESNVGIKLAIGVNCLEPEVQLTLSYEKDMEFKLPGFLSVKASKSERIVSVKLEKAKGWKPDKDSWS